MVPNFNRLGRFDSGNRVALASIFPTRFINVSYAESITEELGLLRSVLYQCLWPLHMAEGLQVAGTEITISVDQSGNEQTITNQ